MKQSCRTSTSTSQTAAMSLESTAASDYANCGQYSSSEQRVPQLQAEHEQLTFHDRLPSRGDVHAIIWKELGHQFPEAPVICQAVVQLMMEDNCPVPGDAGRGWGDEGWCEWGDGSGRVRLLGEDVLLLEALPQRAAGLPTWLEHRLHKRDAHDKGASMTKEAPVTEEHL